MAHHQPNLYARIQILDAEAQNIRLQSLILSDDTAPATEIQEANCYTESLESTP